MVIIFGTSGRFGCMQIRLFEIKKMTFSDFKGILILLKKNRQKKVLVTVVKFQMNFHVHHFKNVYFFTIFYHFMSLLWFKIKNLPFNLNFFRNKKQIKFNFKKKCDSHSPWIDYLFLGYRFFSKMKFSFLLDKRFFDLTNSNV